MKKSNLDPRILMGIVAVSSMAAVIAQSLVPALAFTFTIFLFATIYGADIAGVFKKCRRLWQVVIFASLMQSIFAPSGQAVLHIGSVALLTTGGIEKGIVVLLRLASLMCGAALLLTCGQERLSEGMIRLGIPYEFVYMVLIGLRFLPVLREEMQDSLNAIQLRGVDLKNIPLSKKTKVYSYLLFPVVSASIIRAQELSVSMEMRGFRAFHTRTSMIDIKTTPFDWVVFTLFVFAEAGILFLL